MFYEYDDNNGDDNEDIGDNKMTLTIFSIFHA